MISIDFDIVLFQEKETYITYCPELDISSCGETADQAKERVKTAVRLFVEEAEKMGTLETILEESNYIKDSKGKWKPPKLISTEMMSL